MPVYFPVPAVIVADARAVDGGLNPRLSGPARIYAQVPEMPRLLADVLSRGWPDSNPVGRDKEHAGIDIEAELAKLLRDPQAKVS